MTPTDTSENSSLSKLPKWQSVVDTHVHLDDLARESQESMDNLAAKAFQAGISALVIPGLHPQQWQTISEFAGFYEQVYFAVGVHPWWIQKENVLSHDQLVEIIANYVEREDCVAIGETGLDKLKKDTLKLQRDSFIAHLDIALELNKPAIVHCVRAHDEMQRVLKRYKTPVRGVIHGFSGSLDVAQHYWRKGLYIGVGGTITYERASKTRDAVSNLPIEALVLETDAPAMPLKGHQGQPNRSEMITGVASCLAELRGEDVNYIVKKTTENACRLFDF